MIGSMIGTQPFFNDAVTTVVNVKAAPGFLHSLRLVNTTAAVAYLQVFAAPAASVTLGTTPPDFVVRLGANESLVYPMPMPLAKANGSGISIAGTTTAAGAVGAAISVSALFE